MDEGEAFLLTPQQFEYYWPSISGQLDTVKHLWEIWWTKEAFHDGVMNGWLNAWVIGSVDAIHLVMFTQVVHYPANTILKVVLLFGNKFDDYIPIMEAVLEKFARDRNCPYIEGCVRDGFRKKFKHDYHGVLLTRKVATTRVQ
jgi:hypothetical protein